MSKQESLAKSQTQKKIPTTKCWRDPLNNTHTAAFGVREGIPKHGEWFDPDDGELELGRGEDYLPEYGTVEVYKHLVTVAPETDCPLCEGRVCAACGEATSKKDVLCCDDGKVYLEHRCYLVVEGGYGGSCQWSQLGEKCKSCDHEMTPETTRHAAYDPEAGAVVIKEPRDNLRKGGRGNE